MINKIKNIDDICRKYNIDNYIINNDGSVDVHGNVYLWGNGLKKLILNFNLVYGEFDCGNNKLKTLKGCPVYVSGYFDCSSNELVSLKYSPREVGGNFVCSYNNIKSLANGPQKIGEDYICDFNKLITLKDSPKFVINNFSCDGNELKTLDYGPEKVLGNYNCCTNNLKNFKGCAKYIGKDLVISYNSDLYSFEWLSCNVRYIYCYGTILYNVWILFEDASKIELFNDMDIIRESKTGKPMIIMERLNEFLDLIGKPKVKHVYEYINI